MVVTFAERASSAPASSNSAGNSEAFSSNSPELVSVQEGTVRAELLLGGYVLTPLSPSEPDIPHTPSGGGGIRASFSMGSTHSNSISEHTERTLVQYLVQSDLKGTIPPTVAKFVSKSQVSLFIYLFTLIHSHLKQLFLLNNKMKSFFLLNVEILVIFIACNVCVSVSVWKAYYCEKHQTNP